MKNIIHVTFCVKNSANFSSENQSPNLNYSHNKSIVFPNNVPKLIKYEPNKLINYNAVYQNSSDYIDRNNYFDNAFCSERKKVKSKKKLIQIVEENNYKNMFEKLKKNLTNRSTLNYISKFKENDDTSAPLSKSKSMQREGNFYEKINSNSSKIKIHNLESNFTIPSNNIISNQSIFRKWPLSYNFFQFSFRKRILNKLNRKKIWPIIKNKDNERRWSIAFNNLKEKNSSLNFKGKSNRIIQKFEKIKFDNLLLKNKFQSSNSHNYQKNQIYSND